MANNGRFEAMALALASGSSIKEASQKAGLSTRQGYRLSASFRMRSRVGELRSLITNEAVGLITTAAARAAATLDSLLDEANEPSVRLNASKAILNALAPLTELNELRSRLDELEKQRVST